MGALIAIMFKLRLDEKAGVNLFIRLISVFYMKMSWMVFSLGWR